MVLKHFGKTILLGLLAICPAYGNMRVKEEIHSDRKRALAEIQGQVRALNLPNRQITVEDAAHQTVTVTVAVDVRVLDGANHLLKLTDLKVGDHVMLYYDTHERTAMQIDRQTTPAETILGKP